MSISDGPGLDDDRGPEISAERRRMLAYLDERAATLRARGRGMIDGEATTYAAQVIEALRSDFRQMLDLGNPV